MKNAVVTVDYQAEKIFIKDINMETSTHLDDEFIVFSTATGEVAIRSSHVLDLVIEDEEK